MPRTTRVESPGCPSLRALTTDALGLIKVVEVHGKVGVPKVVEIWGSPDASRAVIATSFADRRKNPLLAVARKDGVVELLNPLSGDTLTTSRVCDLGLSNHSAEEDPVTGLHLFRTKNNELSSGLCVLLICTEKGKACLRSFPTKDDVSQDASVVNTFKNWDVSAAGKVMCSSVDSKRTMHSSEERPLNSICGILKAIVGFGPPNLLGIFSPTCFTASTFLVKEDHRKIVAGTNNYQVRLYDISAQRRPVLSVDFRESPIRVVTEDLDGHTVYVGTGIGDLASFDMRTGKLLGCFVGKCSGSIRSIARHPELPLLASCGLDSYLRIWDSRTRQLLSAVFLKQHLTNVVIDSYFSAEVPAGDVAEQLPDLEADDSPIEKSTKERTKTEKSKRKLESKNGTVESFELSASEDEEMDKQTSLERKETSKGKNSSKNLKRMKRSKRKLESKNGGSADKDVEMVKKKSSKSLKRMNSKRSASNDD